MQSLQVSPIGAVRFHEERMSIEVERRYLKALQGLKGFSHLNILWWFSDFDDVQSRTVLETPQPYRKAPPVMGIFATRSPIRPNPIALTAVQVINIDYQGGLIHVTYIDAHDGSPVLDIKPYTPSLDRVETPGVPEWCSHWPGSVEESGAFDWSDEFNF